MILVVTGMHFRGFDRLVKAVDELKGNGFIDDVFIQTGFSKYEPKHCRWKKSVVYEEFERLMDEADIIISHGGAGCIASGLERGKPVIVLPRLARFNEASNDNQLHLCKVLADEGKVLPIKNANELPQALEKAVSFRPSVLSGQCQIVHIIRSFLEKL